MNSHFKFWQTSLEYQFNVSYSILKQKTSRSSTTEPNIKRYAELQRMIHEETYRRSAKYFHMWWELKPVLAAIEPKYNDLRWV